MTGREKILQHLDDVVAWRNAKIKERLREQGEQKMKCPVTGFDCLNCETECHLLFHKIRESAHRFLNALRIMRSIDRHELIRAGVIDPDDPHKWTSFNLNPYEFAMRLDDDKYMALWNLIESRQTR